jgi:NifU-like protein involved in Fe-S cluster formation
MDETVNTYNSTVRDHFDAPRNAPCHSAGPGVVFGEAGSEASGTWFRLSARMSEGRLAEIRFEAYGCPHSIAAASLLTEQLQGATVEEASRWTWRAVQQPLEVPAEKRGRLLILEDALRCLIACAARLRSDP